MELNKLTIEQARQGLNKREFTSREITQSCLAQIKKVDKKLQAFLTVTEPQALAQAEAADKKIVAGQAEALTGIPLAIKDAILVQDVRATAGSKILDNYIAPYNATVIEKLAAQGSVLLGKTNLDEFAMGSSTENSGYFPTKNPWDTTRVPGGSSGGSAVAVAADMCIGSLGSDTASSTRQPASFCGVIGLKPTYGRVSRYGLIAMTSSLDQIGPISKTVMDNAILFQAIAGHDRHDATSVKIENIELKNIARDIKGLKIGVPQEYFIDGMDEEVKTLVQQAIKKFSALGAKVTEVSLPLTKYALAVYQLMATSEISSNLARYDGIRYGFSVADSRQPTDYSLMDIYRKSKAKGLGAEAKRRIILGTFALSAGYYDQYYVQAQKLRVLISQEFADIFKKVDCLVSPTAPSVAFKLGEKFADPLMMYLSDIYTVPANIGGICAISIPCGFDQGLPVGLQIMAKPFAEEVMFRAAYNYEQATTWQIKKPAI